MAHASDSSSGTTSSPMYDFSDTDSDRKNRGTSSRPRRLPTSNSKNAVAARMNRMKQKQYVNDLERRMTKLRRKIRCIKRELKDREKRWVNCRRQVAYLRGMLSNSREIGSLLRNIRWRNILPQEGRDDHHRPQELPQIAPQDDEDDNINPITTELFSERIPSKHVSVCTVLP